MYDGGILMKMYENVLLYLQEATRSYAYALGEIFVSNLSEHEKNELIEKIGKFEFKTDFIYEKFPNLATIFCYDLDKNLENFTLLSKEYNKILANINKNDFDNAKKLASDFLENIDNKYFRLRTENLLYEINHRQIGDYSELQDKSKQNFQNLYEIYQKALKFEKSEKYNEAIEVYKNLANITRFHHFQDLAFAGLYRCEKALGL